MLVTISISLFTLVCTGYLGNELSWVLQTSSGSSGWAAPKQYDVMLEGARSLYLGYLPQQGLLPELCSTE